MKSVLQILFSSSTLVVIDQAIFSGSNFLITLFLAQKLDLASFGVFSSVTLVTFLLLSLSNAIIIQPFQVSYVKIEDKKQYFTFLVLFQIIILVSCFGLIQLVNCCFSNVVLTSISLPSGCIFVLGYLFQDFFRKLFLGTANIKKTLLIDVAFVVLVGLGFYCFKNQLTLSFALTIIGVANVFSALPGIQFGLKNYMFPNSWLVFSKIHYSQGKWMASVACLQWCSSNFFVLLSGAYLGIEALGALRLVQSIFGIINVVLQTVENYFLPKVAVLFHQSALEAKKYLLHLTAYGLVLFIGLLFFLFLYSKEMMVLIGGQKYLAYNYVIKAMAILYVFIFLSYPIRIAVRVLVLNKIFFTGYVLSFIWSIVTFHFLLKNFALNGAVIGLILNQILMMGYWYFQLNKKQLVVWK